MPSTLPRTILLVEDEPIIALSEKQILENAGYAVITASTAEAAVERVRSQREIDLVLMDINLGPGIDGTDAAQLMLSERDIPLIFLSSHTSPDVVEKTEGITSYGYVVKNSGETVLLAAIRMAFRLYEACRRVHDREERYRGLFESAPIPMWEDDLTELKRKLDAIVASIDGDLEAYFTAHPEVVRELAQSVRALDANRAVLEMYHVDSKEQFLSDITTSFDDRSLEVFRTELLLIAGGATRFTLDQRHVTETGEPLDLELHWAVSPGCEKTLKRVHVSAIDITARKRAEREIQQLLEQKELLLHETHHRIKNNMNVVRSLLSLQSHYQPDPTCERILQDAAGRVQAMMVLYDKLYRSDNVNAMSARDYLEPLVEEILRQFESAGPVHVTLHISEIVLPARVLSPLGIIINEIITNSIKHAFDCIETPELLVSLEPLPDGALLTCSDNGCGIEPAVLSDAPTTFGRELISSLTQQIDGELAVSVEAGTRYVIRFPR